MGSLASLQELQSQGAVSLKSVAGGDLLPKLEKLEALAITFRAKASR